MSRRKRIISYVRAVFPGANGRPSQSLGEALNRCLTVLPNEADTRLDARDGLGAVRHRWPRRSRASHTGLLLLHISTWVPKQRASTVPHASDGPSGDLSFHAPDEDWDYLIGDGVMLVAGNDCLMMQGKRLHPATVKQYLHDLLERGRELGAGIDPAVTDFELLTVVDPQSYRQIQENGGIRRARLNFGHYLETSRRFGEGAALPVPARIWQGLLDALGVSDRTRHRIREASNVNAQLVLSLDRRRPGLVPEELTDATQSLLDYGDDLTLELASGNRIKKGKMVLRREVSVEHIDDRVNYGHAWELMREYFRDLIQTGAIER